MTKPRRSLGKRIAFHAVAFGIDGVSLVLQGTWAFAMFAGCYGVPPQRHQGLGFMAAGMAALALAGIGHALSARGIVSLTTTEAIALGWCGFALAIAHGLVWLLSS